jgi:hypothetical protein
MKVRKREACRSVGVALEALTGSTSVAATATPRIAYLVEIELRSDHDDPLGSFVLPGVTTCTILV